MNTRLLLSHKLEGIGWFTYEIFKRLTQNHSEVEWFFLFDRPFNEEFIFADNIKPIVVGPPSRHPILWYIWFEQRIPRVLKKNKVDLFISPDGYNSLKSKIRSLPVIHDLNFEHDQTNIPGTAQKYFKKYFPQYANKATRIATVSEYSRQDIAQTYQIDPSKIDLVYNGCGEFFHPIDENEKLKSLKDISNGVPYFIFVGALNPRKNISGMLKAFEIYKQQNGRNKFVIVGEKMFWNQEVANTYESHLFKDDIVFTGRLEGNALNHVLGAAEALMFVSNFEGFGIPIIEAFKCEVPVITSTTTSMPEVAGDAALLCNPGDPESIAKAMHEVEDKKVRSEMIAKGKKRAELFTWDRSAKMMWESIEKTLAE